MQENYEKERDKEEEEQIAMLRKQGIFSDLVVELEQAKKVIENPDVTMVQKEAVASSQPAYQFAEFELTRIKKEYLTNGKISAADQSKLSEILANLM